VAAGLAGCGEPASVKLLADAQAALEDVNPQVTETVVAGCEAAWPSLKEIGRAHRDSAEAPEAFRLASGCLRALYNFNRYTTPDSPWVTAEPAFMLDWLAVRCTGEAFCQKPAEQLLIGMPWQLFLDLQERPELARWRLEAKRENGRVEWIKAAPAGDPGVGS
jgi:hypothetical protein